MNQATTGLETQSSNDFGFTDGSIRFVMAQATAYHQQDNNTQTYAKQLYAMSSSIQQTPNIDQ
jgi:hypothetical protein